MYVYCGVQSQDNLAKNDQQLLFILTLAGHVIMCAFKRIVVLTVQEANGKVYFSNGVQMLNRFLQALAYNFTGCETQITIETNKNYSYNPSVEEVLSDSLVQTGSFAF